MKLINLVNQYIIYRKALGDKFHTNEMNLMMFCKRMGTEKNINNITNVMVNNFLYGKNKNSKITFTWFVKYNALVGFYRYALTRNYVKKTPLPSILPKKPQPFVPYIYSKNELKLIFKTALTYPVNKSHINPKMIYVVLVLTYALGLRIRETLSIRIEDIDLEQSVVTISETKFFKSRIVTFNIDVKKILMQYLKSKYNGNNLYFIDGRRYLFTGRNEQALCISTLEGIFKRIREINDIKRDNSTRQPRIHDLRHTFAVNTLVTWYEKNKNVQKLLPVLSDYLGHAEISSTICYLTMTDNLLHKANNRFEKYAIGGEK